MPRPPPAWPAASRALPKEEERDTIPTPPSGRDGRSGEETDGMELETMTMRELVDLHNDLAPDRPAGPKTFRCRAQAIERICGILSERMGATVVAPEAAGEDALEDGDGGDEGEATAPPAPAAQGPGTRAEEGRTSIRARAEQLLAVVSGLEDGQEVGLTYDEVLAAIRAEHPGCRTTVACLRWYGVRMRGGGARVPPRPSRGHAARSASAT